MAGRDVKGGTKTRGAVRDKERVVVNNRTVGRDVLQKYITVGVPLAAELLDISERGVWRMLKDGQLKGRRINGRTVIDVDDIKAMVAAAPVIGVTPSTGEQVADANGAPGMLTPA